MAHIARRWGRSHEGQNKMDLGCILLALAGAAGVALFGYILIMCVSMEHIHPFAAIQSLAAIFRH
jgi:hypothetical protein